MENSIGMPARGHQGWNQKPRDDSPELGDRRRLWPGAQAAGEAPSSLGAISIHRKHKVLPTGQASRHPSPRPALRTATHCRCPKSPKASPCPRDFSGRRRVRGGKVEVGKGLIGTLDFEVAKEFTQRRLLFLTRQYRIALRGRTSLLGGNEARMLRG